VLVVDDRPPVSLFLSMSMRGRKTPTRLANALQSATRLETDTVKPAATAPKNAERMHGRHAAITNNFNNWRSYEEWAERIRGTWENK